MKKQRKQLKRKKRDLLRFICWLVIPGIMGGFLTADAFGIYTFTGERLTVLGAGVLVLLLPFFSEIRVKDLSVKRGNSGSDKDT